MKARQWYEGENGTSQWLSLVVVLMSTYPVSGEKMPEHELHWIPNLFCTCILLTSVYKPLSLSCISQHVIGPSTHKRYERGRERFFLPLFSSFLFSPSPLVPTINLGGPSPLLWVAGTRRGGGEEGGKSLRGEGSLSFTPSPSPLDSCHTSYNSCYGHSANIDSSWIPHKHYEMFDWNKLL